MGVIEINGLDKLMSDLNKVTEKFPEKRKKLHDKAGKIIVRNVQKNTPYDSSRKSGTHLRDAIYAKTGSKGGYAAVRADYKKAPHAHLVESGHVQETKNGEVFVKGKHMFEKGLRESESELYTLADELAIEMAGELNG